MAIDKPNKLMGMGGLLLSAALGLCLWLGLTLLAAIPDFKVLWDLTPNKSFTVSGQTEDLLAQVRADADLRVEIHTFFEPLPSGQTDQKKRIYGIHRRAQGLTRDLLRQYLFLGGDAIKVVHNNLRLDPLQADKHKKRYRVQGKNVCVVAVHRKDAVGKEVIRSKELSVHDDLAVIDPGSKSPVPGSPDPIPRLADYQGEESVSSALKTLLVEGSPKIYVLTGHQEESVESVDASSYSALSRGLQAEGFQLAQLNLAKADIPEDAAVLACFEPRKEFTSKEADKVLAYLRQGGSLFLNLSWQDRPVDWNPGLQNLLDPLGLQVGQALVCQPQAGSVEQAPFLQIKKLNPVHPVTKTLLQTGRYPVLSFARELRKSLQAPVDLAVDLSLMRTELSWAAGRDQTGAVDFTAPHQAAAYAQRSVGALVDVPGSADGQDGRVAVISGKAFYNRQYQVGGGDLALNLFHWMSDQPQLLEIRRDSPVRSSNIDLGRDLELRRTRLNRVGNFLIFVVPGALLLLALLVFWRRSRS